MDLFEVFPKPLWYLFLIRPLALICMDHMAFLMFFFLGSHLEVLKHERDDLQHQLQNQKLTPADVERINREKRELQQTISSLSKSLEDAEQHKWNEEIALAKVKEKVLFILLRFVDNGIAVLL